MEKVRKVKKKFKEYGYYGGAISALFCTWVIFNSYGTGEQVFEAGSWQESAPMLNSIFALIEHFLGKMGIGVVLLALSVLSFVQGRRINRNIRKD